MKKIIFTIITLGIAMLGYSQSVITETADGKVGIGTTAPVSRLDITVGEYKTYFTGNALTFKNNNVTSYIDKKDAGALRFRMGANYNTAMTIGSNLNVGIGTAEPISKLDITVGEYKTYFTGNALTFKNNNVTSYIDKKDAGALRFRMGANYNTAMTIGSNLNVGIGTITTGIHKLAVEGSIGAREIKVQATGWADFVFKKEHVLPTLTEVERHIKKKGHLKDIPSAAEVKKDGFFLGEMDAKLLQKIEELTLYIIQQEKQLKNQAEEIEKLKVQNKKINKIVKELELIKQRIK